MKYAIIRIQGHQYKVAEGEELLVDKLSTDPSADVLLVVNEDKVSVGVPLVEGAAIKFTVIGEEKGEKIDVFKYKAKSRYRKHIGFRPQYTRLKVDSINL